MSFQAKLFLEENEYNVLTAEYAFSRPIDSSNRPNGRLRGGIVEVTIESGNNAEIISWIHQNEIKNGRLEFTSRDTMNSAQKTLSFTNAFCVAMKEYFVSDGSSPMISKITISAHELNIDNEIHTNTWAGVESSSSSEGGSGSTSSGDTATGNTVTFE